MKWIIIAMPVVCVVTYIALTQVAPPGQNNICVLFKQHPSWYWSAHAAQSKWGVPISAQMAIIRTESHFRADAKPPHKKTAGIYPLGASNIGGRVCAGRGCHVATIFK